MLDWKNREGSAKGPAPEPKSANRSYFRNLLMSRALLSIIGLYLLVTGGLADGFLSVAVTDIGAQIRWMSWSM